MAKFKVGDKVRVRKDLNVGESYSGIAFVDGMERYKGEIFEIEDIEDDDVVFLKDTKFAWLDEMLEEVKEDKMEKTFREVIADIKPGEVWESENNSCNIRITRTKTGISIRDFNDNAIVWFDDDFKFKLQRKEYTFEEAFKAYEEGKEIESCKFKYKKRNGQDYFYSNTSQAWEKHYEGFLLQEIRNKWYIN